ncbi:hypothetical protein M2394_004313 [Pseudomonas sp. BIGb0164]|nr:hypothetical protein [Pseudomonas sp. BIGb0164]
MLYLILYLFVLDYPESQWFLQKQKKTPTRLFHKSQAKKSHSLEWLFS